jgi:dTDP-4-dehydrorhamnose reductase
MQQTAKAYFLYLVFANNVLPQTLRIRTCLHLFPAPPVSWFMGSVVFLAALSGMDSWVGIIGYVMKILVTGVNGLLGQYLVLRLYEQGHQIVALGKGPCRLGLGATRHFVYHQVDLNEESQMQNIVALQAPEVVIHGAAMTQVDECETHRDLCFHTNVQATATLLRAAEQANCQFIYVSSDFVFDGQKGSYQEQDQVRSVNWYGSTKIQAEHLVGQADLPSAIIRTCLVYGNRTDGSRTNIIAWVKDKLEHDQVIQVVDDQVRTPTYAGDLAHGIALVVGHRAEGIFHLAGKDTLTPYDMAVKTADFLGLNKNLIARVNATTFTQPAARPMHTGLVIEKARRLLGYEPLSFEQGLSQMLAEEPTDRN